MFAFRGMSEVSLDEKGRMAVPARYREVLQESRGGQMIITQSAHKGEVWLYPLEAWEAIEPTLRGLPDFSPVQRSVKFKIWGAARECRLDKNGRILVPGELRKAAGLERRVCLVGTGHRFSMFEPRCWKELMGRVEAYEDSGELAEALGPLAL